MEIRAAYTASSRRQAATGISGAGVHATTPLLIINKIDIAEYVHASLDIMERDSKMMRGERPFVFANLYDGVGLETIISFILERGMLPERRPEKLAATA